MLRGSGWETDGGIGRETASGCAANCGYEGSWLRWWMLPGYAGAAAALMVLQAPYLRVPKKV